MSDQPKKYIALSISEKYVSRLEERNAELEVENKRLRELLIENWTDELELLEAALEGVGVDFHYYHTDLYMKAALQGARDEH